MAEMNIPQNGGRRKVQAPRIDLTPMVDLGFLLITFFMFTTTLAQQKAMPLQMPSTEKNNTPTVVPAESTLTLIAVKGHSILYYEGAYTDKSKVPACPINMVTEVVLKKKSTVAALPNSFSNEAHKLHVLIKPDESSQYEDLVHLLDIMLIADVPYYAIVDMSDEDREMVKGRE